MGLSEVILALTKLQVLHNCDVQFINGAVVSVVYWRHRCIVLMITTHTV